MHIKPLKIIKRTVEPIQAIAKPGEVTVKTKEKRKPCKKLSIRAKNAIEGILAGKPQGQAMRDAGYAPSTSTCPNKNLFQTNPVKAELDPFVRSLMHHRDELIEAMRDSYRDAEYGSQSASLNALVKTIQLLTGKATGKIGFDLDADTKDAIKAVIALNAEE